MNTTLTPLAASIERAQAALDRKAAKLGELADRAPELQQWTWTTGSFEGLVYILHLHPSADMPPNSERSTASARAICEALRAQMRAEVETNEDHIIIRLMENWTLLLWRVFPLPTIG